jgi:hypothetical protein
MSKLEVICFLKLKKQIGFIRIFVLFQRYNIKFILKEVKSCLWLFGIVCALMSCEVWIPYLLGFITQNAWWYSVGSACWLFWLGPGTPFIPLCIAITLGLKKIFK